MANLVGDVNRLRDEVKARIINIYLALRTKGFAHNAICGILANLYNEDSSFDPMDVEWGGYLAPQALAQVLKTPYNMVSRSRANELYTKLVDEGKWHEQLNGTAIVKNAGISYSSTAEAFTRDRSSNKKLGIGYGICQWTYPSRKQGLLNLAEHYNTSVGDLDLQIRYLIQEMKSYYVKASTINKYSNVTVNETVELAKFMQREDVSAESSAKIFCVVFERPSNISSAVDTRATNAKSFVSFLANYNGMKSFTPRIESDFNKVKQLIIRNGDIKYYMREGAKAKDGNGNEVVGISMSKHSLHDSAIKSGFPTVLTIPNCTAYANGRFNEIIGEGWSYMRGDYGASKAWENSVSEGLVRKTPQEGKPAAGCMIIWLSADKEHNHIAICEGVNADGTVNVSESNYAGANGKGIWFSCFTTTVDKLINRFKNYDYPKTLVGYVYQPYTIFPVGESYESFDPIYGSVNKPVEIPQLEEVSTKVELEAEYDADIHLWDRKYKLVAWKGDEGFEIGTEEGRNIHIKFSVSKKDATQLQTSSISLWNLSQEHIDFLNQKDVNIELYAGYRESVPLIFRGTVAYEIVNLDGADRRVQIEVLDGISNIDTAICELTYNGSASVYDIVEYLTKKKGMITKYTKSAKKACKNKIMSKYSFYGATKNALSELLSGAGCSYGVSNGICRIQKEGDTDTTGNIVRLLSPDSGLLEEPVEIYKSFETIGNTNATKSFYGYSVKFLLNSGLDVGDYVFLKSRKSQALYRIDNFTIEGDNMGGDWCCNAELYVIVGEVTTGNDQEVK